MRKLLFMLLALPFMFMACSDDDDNRTTVSFERALYELEAGSQTIKITISEYTGDAVDIPIILTGNAVKGTDYSVSAEKFTIGSIASSSSLEITFTLLEGYTPGRKITVGLDLPAGFKADFNKTATIDLKYPILYSFTSRKMTITTGGEIEVSLKNDDGSTFSAEKELRIPVSVRTNDERTTAVLNSDFAFVGDAVAVIPQGKSSGKIEVKYLKETLESGKDAFVLQLDPCAGFTVGENETILVTILGPYGDKIKGSWELYNIVTDVQYMEDMWGMKFEGFGVPTIGDKIIIDDEGFKTEMTGFLTNYFSKQSDMSVYNDNYTLMVGMGDRRTLTLLELNNINRYFSSTVKSEDDRAYLGVRLQTKEISGTSTEVMEVFIIDYLPKAFFEDLIGYGMFDGERPNASMMGCFLYYEFKKVN